MKRKIISNILFILIFIITILAFQPKIFATTYVYQDFRYTLDDKNEITITKYSGNDENIIIPNIIDGKNVTSIGDKVFYCCDNLKSITIPDSVTSIGESTFCYCKSLTSITIPNSVNSIGTNAFLDCTSLTSVTIPNNVTSISNYAFSNCNSLTNITIPNSVTSIGSKAFLGCSNITDIIIPDSVTSIGDGAFSASGLTSIIIPSSVTKIEAYTFQECNSLKSIVLPDSITSINDSAFSHCKGLTNITIPNGITNISNKTFDGCTSLASIQIPNGVISIGDGAFSYCTSLTSITIPNTVTSIGDSAFYFCKGLTSITIPNSVTSIGESALSRCSGLTDITIPNSITNISGSLFESCAGLTSIEIPNNVTSIDNSAFSYCTGLTSITIPDNITSIGSGAFSNCTKLVDITISNGITKINGSLFKGCTSLTSITIPESVTSIGFSAFNSCTSLTSITIPNSVNSIGTNAFYGCTSLRSIALPNSITSIGSSAFASSGLTSVIIPNSMTSIGDNVFSHCKSLTSISIPNSVIKIEHSAFNCCTSLTSIKIPDSVTSIENGVFWYCINLKEITIPNSVNSMGTRVFEYCEKLTNVTISNSVTSIEDGTFHECTSLTSITIPNSVTSLGSEVFKDCTSLTSVTIPNSVTSIGGKAFYNCENLKSVTIPDNITNINGYTFYACNSLTNIKIPNKVTSIGYEAFKFCESLTSIEIPNSVTSIGISAFSYCTSLTSITIPNSVIKIDSGVFYKVGNQITLYLELNSYAETYAKENNLKYEYIKISENNNDNNNSNNDNSNNNNNNSNNNTNNTNNNNVAVNINVTFNANGGKVSTSKKAVTVGSKYGSLPIATRSGYVFNGWYTAKSGGTKVTADSVVTTKSNQTLYARWKARISIKTAKVSISKATFENNKAVKPSVTVKIGSITLKNGTDYNLSFSNNKKVSKKAKVKITGIGAYKDCIEKIFEISKKAINTYPIQIKLKTTSYTYDGKAKKPTVVVSYDKTTLKSGTDYKLDYSNNKNVGTGKVKIIGKGNYSGSKNLSFTINKATQSIKYNTKISKTYKEKGKTYSLDVKNVKDSAKISYSSSNKKVATVDKNGKVKIVGGGKATITIKVSATKNYKALTKKATVLVKKEQKLNISDLKVKYQKALVNLNINVKENAKLSYKSDDTKVVKIKNGQLSLIGLGTAKVTITAKETSNYASASKTIKVTVKKGKSTIEANNIEKSSNEKTFNIGAKIEGNGKVTYKSSNSAVGTVDKKGNITLTGVLGETKITITVAGTKLYEKATKTVTITVKENIISPVDLSKGNWFAIVYNNHVPSETFQRYATDWNLPDNADVGLPVRAIADGKVEYSNTGSGSIQIRHSVELTLTNGVKYAPYQWFSWYGHMRDIVANGTVVKKGDTIGYISRASADNDHLHFSIYAAAKEWDSIWSTSKAIAISPYWIPGVMNNTNLYQHNGSSQELLDEMLNIDNLKK